MDLRRWGGLAYRDDFVIAYRSRRYDGEGATKCQCVIERI